MASPVGPVQFPAQMAHELHGKPCPACAEPVAAVLVDSIVTMVPTGRPSALGVVEMTANPQTVMFTFQPCGCRTTPDGKLVPAAPLVTVTALDAETHEPLDAQVTITPLPGVVELPERVRRFKGRVVRPRA